MSALKDQDPDYGPSSASNEKHQRIFEENARSSTARKITDIVEREFSQEVNAKEKEILEIQERLHRASKALHLLRYIIVADFYNRKQCLSSQNGEAKQLQIHPAIKQLIGKAPKFPENSSTSDNESYFDKTIDFPMVKTEKIEDSSDNCRIKNRKHEAEEDSRPKKIPRYIPPKSGVPKSQSPSRGVRHKVRKRIIIGNISKWIPPEWREDPASHKWTMYVRGNKENPDIDDFVNKVRFFLHPSYRPNDVVEVTTAPFCLSRRGWGEFPLRVQLHFKSSLNKPMDIIHHLKLDRTYTGLQTLGSETIVDIWIHDLQNSKRNLDKVSNENDCKVKLENDEEADNSNSNETVINKLSDKNSDVLIKNELQDAETEYLMNIKKLQSYVELDHDYCGPKYLKDSERNLTIDHSLRKVSPVLKKEKITGEHSMNGDLRTEESVSKLVPLSCSKISNLRPLEISIPPLFEPSGSKHVLVLENNKTISVDIAVPHKEDATKSKTNLIVSRGISLLKKQTSGPSETTVQIRNPNAKTQQGLKVQLSKSVLLNVNSNVPVLKIAERRNFNYLSASAQASKSSRQKITLCKDKLKLQSKKELYEEVFKTIDATNIPKIQELLRFIFRRMPMITRDAVDPDYRRVHPYACASEEELFGYSGPKRSAYEWHRAKAVRCLLKKKAISEDQLWTVKEIIIWARLHGYTPLRPDFTFESLKQQKSLPDSVVTKAISTCTEPEAFYKWVQVHPGRSNDRLDCVPTNVGPDVELDVVNVDVVLENNKKLWGREESKESSNTKITVLELEVRLTPLYDFVCETARDIGIRLTSSEEVAPKVVHCAAARTVMRAVECLVEDLVRMSLAKAWERNSGNGYPKVIVLDDVRGALLSREEFDVFTNQGLGSKYRLASME